MRGDEELYRDLLAFQLKAAGFDTEVEVPLPFGRADIRSRDRLIEVEFLRTWRHGVRQALAYAWQMYPAEGWALPRRPGWMAARSAPNGRGAA